MDKLPRLGKRELICLLLFTCNYVVSVWRGFQTVAIFAFLNITNKWISSQLFNEGIICKHSIQNMKTAGSILIKENGRCDITNAA